MPSIVVVGEINLDITAMISDTIDLKKKSFYEAEQTVAAIGGKAYAQTIQIANLDCNVSPIATIGGNEEDAIKGSLTAVQGQQNARAKIPGNRTPVIKINLEHIYSVEGSETDRIIIVRKNHREASDTIEQTESDFYLKISSYVGSQLGSQPIAGELFEGADLMLLNSSIPKDVLDGCLDIAVGRNIPSILSVTAQFQTSFTARATYVVVDPNRPDQIVQKRPQNLLVTDGWSSCQYNGTQSQTSGYRLKNETLPHGLNVRSAFEAAFAVMMARGEGLEKAVEFGLKAGVYKGQIGHEDVLQMGTRSQIENLRF